MPLAHILAPQIARKAAEIETALGHNAGYLQTQGAGAQTTLVKNPPRDNGMPKKAIQSYDPRLQTPEASAAIAAGTMMNSPDPSTRRFGHGLYRRLNQPTIVPMPNAGEPSGEPIATDELGRPIYAPPTPAKKGGRVIALPAGEPVAQTEGGVQLDRAGKKLGGYLDQEAMTPGMRYLNRRPGDLNLDDTNGNILRDAFARAQLDHVYGPHLKAMQDNRDADGMPTDKLPDGYFEALGEQRGKPYTKDERENVLKGLKKLREVQKYEEAGGGGRA